MYRIKIRVISRLHPLQILQPCYLFIYFLAVVNYMKLQQKFGACYMIFCEFALMYMYQIIRTSKQAQKLNYNSYCYHRQRKWGNESTLLKRNKQFT